MRVCIIVCRHSGLDIKQYCYYDPNTCGFNFKGAVDDILVRCTIVISFHVQCCKTVANCKYSSVDFFLLWTEFLLYCDMFYCDLCVQILCLFLTWCLFVSAENSRRLNHSTACMRSQSNWSGSNCTCFWSKAYNTYIAPQAAAALLCHNADVQPIGCRLIENPWTWPAILSRSRPFNYLHPVDYCSFTNPVQPTLKKALKVKQKIGHIGSCVSPKLSVQGAANITPKIFLQFSQPSFGILKWNFTSAHSHPIYT